MLLWLRLSCLTSDPNEYKQNEQLQNVPPLKVFWMNTIQIMQTKPIKLVFLNILHIDDDDVIACKYRVV